jgi:predicted PolB exonuclease-like 3'-5' exonuclease
MVASVLCFDIETVPDVAGGRRVLELAGLTDREVAELMLQRQRQRSGNEFLRHHLQRVVAISVAMRTSKGQFLLRSVGDPGDDEAELIRRFFSGIDRYTPALVSWNGGGFDLPVLHYRSLLHGISAPRYWDVGEADTSFRYNNYIGRFHWRHLDLMDVLAGYQLRAAAPLQEIALLLGLPGKLGMDGSQVWESYSNGALASIRNYCDTDVLNTYLIYLRFELLRGRLGESQYRDETDRVRKMLSASEAPHLRQFLSAWKAQEVTE